MVLIPRTLPFEYQPRWPDMREQPMVNPERELDLDRWTEWLERRDRELEDYLAKLGSGGGVLDVLVAASNAPQKAIDMADYICDGTDDQVEIQEAVDFLQSLIDVRTPSLHGLPSGGLLRLSSGDFYLSAPVSLTGNNNISIIGHGTASTLLHDSSAEG